LFPTFDGGEDAIGIGGPHEGLGPHDVAVERRLEVHGWEHPSPEPPLGEHGKEGLDRIEPRARRSG
jgi:hypothetical protein